MLNITGVLDANSILRELRSLKTTILFWKPDRIQNVFISTFLNASHAGCGEKNEQSEKISGLMIVTRNNIIYYLFS